MGLAQWSAAGAVAARVGTGTDLFCELLGPIRLDVGATRRRYALGRRASTTLRWRTVWCAGLACATPAIFCTALCCGGVTAGRARWAAFPIPQCLYSATRPGAPTGPLSLS